MTRTETNRTGRGVCAVLAAATLLVAVVVAAASAASPGGPVFWSVGEAQHAVAVGPGGANAWTLSAPGVTPPFLQPPYFKVRSVSCSGFGVSRAGDWPAFLCSVAWEVTADVSETIHVTKLWTRVWRDRSGTATCASERALIDCPPPPAGKMLPGDPRSGGAASGVLMAQRAEDLTKHDAFVRGQVIANVACGATSYYVYVCTYSTGRTTVGWVKGAARWRVTVATATT